MNRGTLAKALIFSLAVAGMALASMPVQAGSTGNGTAGGGFPQYRYEADAKKNRALSAHHAHLDEEIRSLDETLHDVEALSNLPPGGEK